MNHKPVPVLDKGFIRVVDRMGDDTAIVQAARVSYGAGTKSVRTDRDLIRYLMRNNHTTPFEMCEIKLHIKLPIFVARQWARHRTASVNEVSARYSVMADEFYTPELDQIAAQSTINRQGRGEPLGNAEQVREALKPQTYGQYEALLGFGLARELARTVLPVSAYTEWYWKSDLHNLFHFLKIRADAHAQYEIRAYAEALCRIVSEWVPVAYEAFEDYRLNAVTFSAQAMDCLRRTLAGERITYENSGLGAREWADFQTILYGPA